MNRAYWAGRRVFITGHTGFMGGWLSLWLQELGAELTGYALPPETEHHFFGLTSLGQSMRSHLADIRDYEKLRNAMESARPEVVFHLAAQPIVRRSYADPIGTYGTNVMGSVHLLEAVRRVETVKAVVVITSDKCYENREWYWGYRETDPMGGYDPYSSSKGCTELVTNSFRRSFFSGEHDVALASVRAGNVIGGGDWAEDRLIPDFIRSVVSQKPLMIRNPSAVRPWQHVLEPLNGYLILAERLAKGERALADGWNFGPREEDAKPVSWIVDRLVSLWGEGARWAHDGTPQPHEAHFLRLDCSKARQELGWSPEWTLPTALEEIASWYKSWKAGANMREVSSAQIQKFNSRSAVAQ